MKTRRLLCTTSDISPIPINSFESLRHNKRLAHAPAHCENHDRRSRVGKTHWLDRISLIPIAVSFGGMLFFWSSAPGTSRRQPRNSESRSFEVRSMKLKLPGLVVFSLFLVAPRVLSLKAGMPPAQPRPDRTTLLAKTSTISELTPDEIRIELSKKIDALLRGELTAHWYPHAVNRERGGFHQSMSRDWSLQSDTSVFSVYQARMTWTAAAFAQYSPAHRDEFASYAHHGIVFLDKVLRDKEFGGFHWVLDRDGQLDKVQGDEKHVYGTSFVDLRRCQSPVR